MDKGQEEMPELWNSNGLEGGPAIMTLTATFVPLMSQESTEKMLQP